MAKNSLFLYRQKRDFTKTLEPRGKAEIGPWVRVEMPAPLETAALAAPSAKAPGNRAREAVMS